VPSAVCADAVFKGGTVNGSGGCNAFSGGYKANGAALSFGPQDQETQYLAALQNAATYQVQGLSLEMRDANGALQVEFAASTTAPSPTPSVTASPTPSATAPQTSAPTAAPSSPAPSVPPTSTSGTTYDGAAPLGLVLVAATTLLLIAYVKPPRRARDR
jgi:hypothetical protein